MAFNIKNLASISQPRAAISSDQVSGTKLPLQPVDRQMAPPRGDLFTSLPSKPIGTKPVTAPTQQPADQTTRPTAPPRSGLGGLLGRLRQGLGTFLKNIEPHLPGELGKLVSRMAKACSYGGGDGDFGTTKLPIQPG